MLERTGVPTKENIESVTPSKERLSKGPVAIIECFQEIPCNPCYTSCKKGAIKELIDINDRPILDPEKCNGCGTCEKVCPVNNIKIVDKKPEFQHKCEMCFACDEWCPYNAIHHWSRPEGVKYHHPEVKISDMLCKKVLDGN